MRPHTSYVALAWLPVAATPGAGGGGTGGVTVDPERVTPGVLGFLVVLAIGLATWALLRSMTRHLKKIQLPRAEGEAERRPPAPGPARREGGEPRG
ncbi:MAG: hypothetical protein M3P48_10750 [Actinomycetota bacterium]|nr:hypothetical protein [Actinomycetota bacterium]